MAVCARYFDGAAPRRSFLCHNAPGREDRDQTQRHRDTSGAYPLCGGLRKRQRLGRYDALCAVGRVARLLVAGASVHGARARCVPGMPASLPAAPVAFGTHAACGRGGSSYELGDPCVYLSDPGRHTGRFCDRHGTFGWVRHLAHHGVVRCLRAYWPARHHRSLRLQHRRDGTGKLVLRPMRRRLGQCAHLASAHAVLRASAFGVCEGAEERGRGGDARGLAR